MSRALCAGIACVLALASCAHPHRVVEPTPAPVEMPASLTIAVTDPPDSVADWLSRRGEYHIAAHTADSIRLVPIDVQAPSLLVHRIRARDARDAMDAGVDAVLTGDPDAVAYAATRADLASLPLSWNRTYMLVVPASRAADSASDGSLQLDTLRAQLAAGAVRVEARAVPPAWTGDGAACSAERAVPAAPSTASQPGTPPRIAYPRADDVARSIAARLVALGAGPGSSLGWLAPSLAAHGNALRAVAVDGADAARWLETGTAAAAVVGVPSGRALACPAEAGHPGASVDSVALIQTRERLIARRALVGRPLDALLRAAGEPAGSAP